MRNRPLPTRPVEVHVKFKFSKVIGDFPDKNYTKEDLVEILDGVIENKEESSVDNSDIEGLLDNGDI